ncbi:MAG: diaminopimelate dehydrogenase [Clostridia bacterium]|nr:diaminopimelate dehydrogenase [Clostridia bacterium]
MKFAIYGYGNLGRGVELAAAAAKDVELFGVFTRRDPDSVKTQTGIPVYRSEDILKYKNDIDVIIICGGSATDLPVMTPRLARDFNVIDSFDTHSRIADHFAAVNDAAKASGHTAIISVGWDPGMFSLARIYGESILPDGKSYTFWGKGVSQGHSDACRRVDGVADARQYTVPRESAIQAVRSGRQPELSATDGHTREVYVVAKEGADKAKIESDIKNMPAYFEGYETTVNFISREEMNRDHSELPHGGFVIRTGGTANGHKHVIEYSLKLDSNPEFTSSVLVAYARAAYKLNARGDHGCKTVFDIAPADLSPLSPDELRAHLL